METPGKTFDIPFPETDFSQWSASPNVDLPISHLSKIQPFLSDAASFSDSVDKKINSLSKAVFAAVGSSLHPALASSWVSKACTISIPVFFFSKPFTASISIQALPGFLFQPLHNAQKQWLGLTDSGYQNPKSSCGGPEESEVSGGISGTGKVPCLHWHSRLLPAHPCCQSH